MKKAIKQKLHPWKTMRAWHLLCVSIESFVIFGDVNMEWGAWGGW
jgi:hypothetical protein